MSHPFDILHLPNGAKFIFTPCPGTKDASVGAALAAFRDAGAVAVVTMMQMPELIEHEADNIPILCAEFGMQWFHLPVEDSCAPAMPFEQAFAQQKEALLALVQSGATIVIHCHGGSGRTGMMAAILMLELGYDADFVRTQIQQIRPKSLKSAVQVAYLENRYAYNA